MYQVLRRFSALACVLLPYQLAFAADDHLTIKQPDFELELECVKASQSLTVVLTLPNVFALAQDKSSVIIQDEHGVVAKLYGEASIQKFVGDTKTQWLQTLTSSQSSELRVETISFRTGNTVSSNFKLAEIKEQLNTFSANCI